MSERAELKLNLLQQRLHDAECHYKSAMRQLGDQNRRERFEAACFALQGMLAETSERTYTGAADDAVRYADALLAELSRPQPPTAEGQKP